jgi:NAD(P)-dependent dehydrogenase (short-subunit alcohol dehydrogenase family)
MRLRGRHALVTGGLGTIGRALCAGFAAEGARVTVLDRPGGAAPEGMGWVGVDLSDLSAAAGSVAGLGPVDVLVNNAAVIENRPHQEFSLEEYEEQVRVNAGAAFALARAVTPGMRERGWGRIISMTSLTLNGQWEGYVPYVASKGALLGLTRGLARELGPFGITVNAIAPGAVVSEAEQRVFADRLEAYDRWVLERQCLKRRIVPEDVVGLALFLASDAAAMITGQNIHVDGGW